MSTAPGAFRTSKTWPTTQRIGLRPLGATVARAVAAEHVVAQQRHRRERRQQHPTRMRDNARAAVAAVVLVVAAAPRQNHGSPSCRGLQLSITIIPRMNPSTTPRDTACLLEVPDSTPLPIRW